MDRDSELCKQVEDLTAINAELLSALKCLRKDMEMLRDGSWVPDEDSIEASIDLATEAINKAEGKS